MIDKNKTLEFLRYINTPMSKESISVLYSANNIKYEKCELYNDYVQSLIALIFDTYLGDDITNSTEQMNHFRWCWYRNRDNFKKEGISIGNTRLYTYFLEFMLEHYYAINQKDNNPIICENIVKLWVYIFDYANNNNTKSKSDIDTFIEIYKLFENSLIVE